MTGPVDRRLLGRPVVRRALAAPVGLGAVSAASVVVQALALATLIASAMPGAARIDRLAAFAWLAGAAGLRGACALLGELASARGASAAKAELRTELVTAAVDAAPAGSAVGAELATLAGRGLDALDSYIGRCLPDLVLAATVPLALAAVVGWLDWVSGLIVLVAIGLFPLFGALVGRASASLASERWRQVTRFGTQVADVFEGLLVLKAFGRSRAQRARIAEVEQALRKASMSTLRVAFLSALVLDTLASVSVALVAVPLGLRLLQGSVHLAPALAVLIVAPEVFLPLRRASAEFHESTEGLAAAAQAMDLITSGRTRPTGVRRLPAPDPAQVPLALEKVHTEALHGVSLTIWPGETVALLGPNGAGKSTIVSLLAGLLAPAAGAVTAGGLDLADIDMDAWRLRISYLSDRPAILADTVATNLRLAAPRADNQDLAEALRAVALADDIGLDTRIGPGGRAVSAGERQRIALARALLRPASLMLLDEPTAHLDPDTETEVVDRLAERFRGRTALIVTHRPALLGLACRVLTLKEGRLEHAEPAGMPA